MLLQKRRTRERSTAINAGSMADIAFLLLIFFLVTTTIYDEKVLKVKLPPWSENTGTSPGSEAILDIKINGLGELLVEKELLPLEELRQTTIGFIQFPKMDDGAPREKGSGIISLQHDANSKYGQYIKIYDELKAAYAYVHQLESMSIFGKDFSDLNQTERNEVLEFFPIRISEADFKIE